MPIIAWVNFSHLVCILQFLEEDNFGTYAKTLVKCFLAEGVTSNHSLFVASADSDPDEIWKVWKFKN